MHLNIKNDEAHKLATELAGLTGESLTSAVTLALQERLARERRRRRPDQVAARLMKIGSQYSALADTGRSRMKSLAMTIRGCRLDRGR
jgi:antitoxin VapB